MINVTITGADDGVDPNELRSLSAQYPFVEWGILYSIKCPGEPRYPSVPWLIELGEMADMRLGTRGQPQFSLHLCGEAARRALSGEFGHLNVLREAVPFQRVQLNGYAHPLSLSFFESAARRADIEFILQTGGQTGESVRQAASDAKLVGYASILIDPSGGRGVSSVHAMRGLRVDDSVRFGVAGGVDPLNVGDAIEAARIVGASWIDMESGVRTDNRFDLAKVRSVLEQVRAVRRAA
jgi:phosphoribosylanthranilate isomerase